MKTALLATHLIAAGAFAVGFLSGPALAAEPQAEADKLDFKFYYEPSELSNSEGAKKLLTRLEAQVERRCSGDAVVTQTQRSLVRDCIEDTMSKAIAGFGSSTVAEVYKTRTGG